MAMNMNMGGGSTKKSSGGGGVEKSSGGRTKMGGDKRKRKQDDEDILPWKPLNAYTGQLVELMASMDRKAMNAEQMNAMKMPKALRIPKVATLPGMGSVRKAKKTGSGGMGGMNM